MKKTKLIAIMSATGVLSAPLIAAACNNDSSSGKQNSDPSKGPQDNKGKVVFRLPQGADWPLAQALQPLVDYYNKTQKDQPDFVEVKTAYSEKNGIFSEFQLIKSIKQDIEAGRDENVPNLILGALSGTYLINQHGRLLDVSDTGVNKSLFDKEIADLHSKLSGKDDETKLYNLPFDNADVNGLTFNLDLMYKMFDLIEKGGGKVDKDSEIYKAAKKASTEGSNIPAGSVWNHLLVKDSTSLKSLDVKDSTFSTLEGVRHFSKTFAEGVKIDETKLSEIKETGEVYSIDYQEATFLQELQARTGKDTFELVKTNDVNEPTKIKYNLVADDTVKNEFKSLWKDYMDSVVQHVQDNGKTKIKDKEKDKTANKSLFQSVKYMQNGYAEWGSWNIMRYRSAISYAASVGANQNRQTPWSNWFFTKALKLQSEESFKTNAKDQDVLMKPQIILNKDGGKKVFQEGGSSIIPVSSKDEKINAGTKAFIKWLYTGKNDIIEKGVEEDNWKFFAKLSGYVMPLKSVATKEGLKWIQDEHAKYVNRLEKYEKDLVTNKDDKEKVKQINEAIFQETRYKNFLTSAEVSLRSILELQKTDVKPLNLITDDKTSQMTGAILNGLFKSTVHEGSETKDADALIKSFENAVR